MKKVYLMRHGETERPDLFCGPKIALSERGRRQIAAAARDLSVAGVKPGVIVHSPYLRTTQSAEITAEILGMDDLMADQRLEEWQVGPWLDKPLEEFFAATGYHASPPPLITDERIESLEHMAGRVVSAIRDTLLQADEALIVAHREPMVSALLKLQGLDFSTIRDVDFEMAAVWEVVFEGGVATSFHKIIDRSRD